MSYSALSLTNPALVGAFCKNFNVFLESETTVISGIIFELCENYHEITCKRTFQVLEYRQNVRYRKTGEFYKAVEKPKIRFYREKKRS